MTAIAAVLGTSCPCPAQTTRIADATGAVPAGDIAEQVRQVVIRLGDDDPQVRATAELQARNLPAEAFPVIRDRYKAEDVDPGAAAALKSVTGTLSARYHIWKTRQESLAWEKRELLEAYEKSQPTAGPWEADAREALALMPGLRLAEDDWLVASRRLELLRRAVDAGCENPVVWACYAACDLEHGTSDNSLRINPLGQPRLGDGLLATDVDQAPPDPRSASRLGLAAAAIAAGNNWSAWSQCFILRTWLDYQLATGAEQRELMGTRSAIHAVLPDALWDCPPEAQLEMVLKQYELERLCNPRRDSQGVMDAVYAPYAKAAPGAVGPMLFKAIVMRDCAQDWLNQNRRPWDDPQAKPPGYSARLAVATEALDAAWKIDPGNPRVAAQAIITKQVTDAPREEIDDCFNRAMAADPDNLEACHYMRAYLVAKGGEHASEQLMEFGRKCRDRLNFRGRVAFMLLQAHVALAMESPDPREYFTRPAVWTELRETYEACLRVFPDSALDRATYAKLAVAAGDYDIADQQFKAVGDRGDVGVWGGQQPYDFYRLESARKASLLRSGVSLAGPAPAPPDGEFAKVLEQADGLDDASQDSATLLGSVARRFPEVKAGTERGQASWSKLTLNSAGKGVDCIRVRTPSVRTTDMRWVFCYPNGRVTAWHILRADAKPMNGFIQYTSFDPNAVKNMKHPGDGGNHTGVAQQLPASCLEPDTEYLIEFRFKSAEPALMTFAVDFLPAGNARPDWPEILNDMGLKRK